MKLAFSVSANRPPSSRKDLARRILAMIEPVSHIAAQHQVSRKFLYQQGHKAEQTLDEAFAKKSADEQAVLF